MSIKEDDGILGCTDCNYQYSFSVAEVCDCPREKEEAPKFFSAWDKLKRDYPECVGVYE